MESQRNPFPVAEFESAAIQIQSSVGDLQEAIQAMEQFQVMPDIWKYVPDIWRETTHSAAKFFLLTIFKKVIRYFWIQIPIDFREVLKEFIFNVVTSPLEGLIANQADLCFIEIFKKEWPHNWLGLTYRLTQASKTSPESAIMVNNLFKLISQDIMETVPYGVNSERRRELENSCHQDSVNFLSFILDSIQNSSNDNVTLSALAALESLMKWIDPQFFSSSVLANLVRGLFPNNNFKIPLLHCFSAIANSRNNTAEFLRFIDIVFGLLIEQLCHFFCPGFDFPSFCVNASELCHSVILALTDFLSFHNFRLLFGCSLTPDSPIVIAIQMLMSLTENSHGPSFELCLGFWENVTHCSSVDVQLPLPIVDRLQIILVEKICPPSDFIFIEGADDSRHQAITSILQATSHSTRDTLKSYLISKVQETDSVNIAFAVNAIAGQMSTEEEECNFIQQFAAPLVSKQTLQAAVSVMVACVPYFRFLNRNPQFLMQLGSKLVEWMLDTSQPPLQNFAAKSLLSCVSLGSSIMSKGLFDPILQVLPQLASQLPSESLPLLYKALALGIHEAPNQAKAQAVLQLPLSIWNSAFSKVNESINYPNLVVPIRIFANMIPIKDAMINELLTQFINESLTLFKIITGPLLAEQLPRDLKSELYGVFTALFKAGFVNNEFLMTLVLDYRDTPTELRFPEALECVKTYLVQLTDHFDSIPEIIFDVVVTTAQMIASQCEEIPELELALFDLVSVIISVSMRSTEPLSSDVMIELFNLIDWGLKRQYPQVNSIVLNSVLSIVENVGMDDTPGPGRQFLEVHSIPLLLGLFTGLMRCDEEQLLSLYSRVVNKLLLCMSRFVPEPKEVIVQFLAERISTLFENSDVAQIYDFILGLISEFNNYSKFSQAVRDLIVDLKNGVLASDPIEEEFNHCMVGSSGSFVGSFTPPCLLDVPIGISDIP